MAKKVSVAKAEEEALIRVFEWAKNMGCPEKKHMQALMRLMEKLDKPQVKLEGLSLADAENALAGCSKYVPYVGGNPYPLTASLARLKINDDQLQAVGQWIDRQSWLRGGVALGTILRNWANWLAQAVNEEGRLRGTWAGRTAGIIEGQRLPETEE